MSNQMCWVIKKGEYFVNADFRVLFTGRTTGFIGYDSKDRMKKDLERLGSEYYAEYINLWDVPRGKRVYDY